MVPKSCKQQADFSLKVCDPPQEKVQGAEPEESDDDEDILDVVLSTESGDPGQAVQEYVCLMAKKGDKYSETEDLASTYSDDSEVHSNPYSDFE